MSPHPAHRQRAADPAFSFQWLEGSAAGAQPLIAEGRALMGRALTRPGRASTHTPERDLEERVTYLLALHEGRVIGATKLVRRWDAGLLVRSGLLQRLRAEGQAFADASALQPWVGKARGIAVESAYRRGRVGGIHVASQMRALSLQRMRERGHRYTLSSARATMARIMARQGFLRLKDDVLVAQGVALTWWYRPLGSADLAMDAQPARGGRGMSTGVRAL